MLLVVLVCKYQCLQNTFYIRIYIYIYYLTSPLHPGFSLLQLQTKLSNLNLYWRSNMWSRGHLSHSRRVTQNRTIFYIANTGWHHDEIHPDPSLLKPDRTMPSIERSVPTEWFSQVALAEWCGKLWDLVKNDFLVSQHPVISQRICNEPMTIYVVQKNWLLRCRICEPAKQNYNSILMVCKISVHQTLNKEYTAYI